MIEEIKTTNWYYISALVFFTNNEGKTLQYPWAGVIPVDADKITGPMLEQMSTFVMNKFAQENEIQKPEQLHSVTLLGVSFLGRMSANEFQGVTNATNTVQ